MGRGIAYDSHMIALKRHVPLGSVFSKVLETMDARSRGSCVDSKLPRSTWFQTRDLQGASSHEKWDRIGQNGTGMGQVWRCRNVSEYLYVCCSMIRFNMRRYFVCVFFFFFCVVQTADTSSYLVCIFCIVLARPHARTRFSLQPDSSLTPRNSSRFHLTK